MLLAASTHDTLRVIATLIAGAGLVGGIAAVQKNARALFKVAPFVVGAVFGIAAWLAGVWARDVIVVEERGGAVTATRMIAPFGWDDPEHSTRVINRTARALRVKAVHYAQFAMEDYDERGEVVLPGSERVCEHAIEYLGPDAHPPDKIRSDVPMDTRYVLTWE